MKTRLARILRNRKVRAALILPTVLIAFGLVAIDTARACWSTILVECFNRPIPQWPWDPPGPGAWKVCVGLPSHLCTPSLGATVNRWGVHSGNYFDIVYCPDDDRSLWCYGYPLSHDPEYHIYPANYDTYVMFGPFSLATATAAQVSFRYWNRSEAYGDSLFWGATTAVNLASNASMQIDTSRSTHTNSGWMTRIMDLADLKNAVTGDSVSMLGQSTVYVFWRFKSNSNNIRDVGSFIDNVLIAVDDGQADLSVHPGEPSIELLHPDTTLISGPLLLGDSLRARYGWRICAGGIGQYDPFRVMLTVGDSVLVDTLVTEGQSGDVVQLYTPLWQPSEFGEFIVRLKVDTLNSIIESNENNNADTALFVVSPPNQMPEFQWIVPSADTLWADSIATLRWFASDPEEPAWVSIFYGIADGTCSGTQVPGGLNRPVLEGEDSLVWVTRFLPTRRTYYVYAIVNDSQNDTCIYAAWPVYVCHNCIAPVTERPLEGIPQEHYLQQNYPNPFNPRTEIRFGLAVPGHVTLRVYDLLGREQAVLIDRDQAAGSYSVEFDGAALSSGLYFYVLTTPEGTLRQKMMLLK